MRGERGDCCLGSNDLDTSGEAELREQFLAISPGQSEGAHVSHTEACNDGGDRRSVLLVESGVHHRVLSPIDELRQSEAVLEVRRKLLSNILLRNEHSEDYTNVRCFLNSGMQCLSRSLHRKPLDP